MNVPSTVLSKLVCDNCEGHLSRGPVLMLTNGKSRCGRCIEPEDGGAHRNLPYEELAKFMTFPCRYKEDGCQEQVKFEDNQEHEDACAYRPFVCPIAESGKCEWFGIRGNLLTHCQSKHPKNIFEIPLKLVHNIVKSSLDNYILSAYQVLFLIQAKVCVTSRNLYDSRNIAKFHFTMDMENSGVKISKPGTVGPKGCLVLQEDTSLMTGINGLLAVLGDMKDTTFTITVIKVQVECVKCKKLTEPGCRNGDGWLCLKCAPRIRSCQYKNSGCTYTDIEQKCLKHEAYFCEHISYCSLCGYNINSGSMGDHYISSHASMRHVAGTEFSHHANSGSYFIIISDFGNLLCQCNQGKILVHTPLPSNLLHLYKCGMKIRDQTTGAVTTVRADVEYSDKHDYTITITNGGYNGDNIITNGSIYFTKNENDPN